MRVEFASIALSPGRVLNFLLSSPRVLSAASASGNQEGTWLVAYQTF